MKAISLFTGAGGLDLGLEAAGFETAAAVECDALAVATLEENRSWNVIPRDIHSVTSAEILRRAKLEVGEATLLVGGPPCQPFSKSAFWARGDVRRLGDPRASTIEEFLRVLADTKPLAFLLENVPGLGYRDKDEGLTLLRQRLEAINQQSRTGQAIPVNYSFQAGILDAAAVGVPQHRHRLFVIGHREGKEFDFSPLSASKPTATKGPLEPDGRSIHRNAWDAIGEWEDDDDPNLQPTGKWAGLLPSIPEGCNYLHLTDRNGSAGNIFGWRTRYWSFLLKLAKDLPSWTITAQPGPATGPFHWKSRRLSARELCALQTFPFDYIVLGKLSAVQRQVGNAVPSALAERLGFEIRRQLLDEENLEIPPSKLLPNMRSPVPDPERPLRLPRAYRPLIGLHPAHPGKGLGPRAAKRKVRRP